MATDPLLSIAEELYALRPAEFTGTRNAWVKRCRSEGDAELARRVGELRKPSMPAWAVNMMVRHQADQMAQVLELGASLRRAQADLDGEALRELARQRRQLTSAVTREGRTLAGELGQRVTDPVADQVQETLHAAMVDEQAAAAVRSGLLVTALVATGVGPVDVGAAVAVPAAIGLTARPRSRPTAVRPVGLRVVPDPEPTPDRARQAREAERAERQRLVDDALAEADRARKKLDKAHKRVGRLQAGTLQTADELEAARGRVAELEHRLEALDEEASRTEEKVTRAEDRYVAAQEQLERARAAMAECP